MMALRLKAIEYYELIFEKGEVPSKLKKKLN